MSEVNVKVAQPTPGEWDVEPVGGGTHWFDLWADGHLIAENIDGPANASLIKASKDMYEALKKIAAEPTRGEMMTSIIGGYRTIAQAAIAKAEAR